MDVSSSGFIPCEMKTTVMKIMSYEHGEFSGTMSNPYFADDKYFSGVMEFLKLMDWLLDSLHCPQRAMESRTSNPFFTSEPAAAVPDFHSLATFAINVLFRQNASWQGRLVWLEQKSETQFRSALELLMLIDGILQ